MNKNKNNVCKIGDLFPGTQKTSSLLLQSDMLESAKQLWHISITTS